MRAAVASLTAVFFLSFGALVARAAPVNLVTNPGFETGGFYGWTYTFTDLGSGLSDEFNCGVAGLSVASGFYVHSGSYGGYFGPQYGPCSISQTIATVPGRSYDLGGWLRIAAPDVAHNNWFETWWDSSLVIGLYNESSTGWGLGSFPVVAGGPSSVITLKFFNPAGVFAMDDLFVTETVVPEPASLILLGTGLVGLRAWRRRKR